MLVLCHPLGSDGVPRELVLARMSSAPSPCGPALALASRAVGAAVLARRAGRFGGGGAGTLISWKVGCKFYFLVILCGYFSHYYYVVTLIVIFVGIIIPLAIIIAVIILLIVIHVHVEACHI